MAGSYTKVCGNCGKDFSVYKHRLDVAKYCSVQCADAAKIGVEAVPIRERFWGKIDIRREDECWMWLGSKDRRGYGSFRKDGSTRKAHRVAYELANGPITGGLHVRHKCDVPSCCNPAHLELGTHQENMMDRVVRGQSKLSDETKALISSAHKGKALSAEHREKLAAAKRGKPSPKRMPVIVNGRLYSCANEAGSAFGKSRWWVLDLIKNGVASYADERK